MCGGGLLTHAMRLSEVIIRMQTILRKQFTLITGFGGVMINHPDCHPSSRLQRIVLDPHCHWCLVHLRRLSLHSQSDCRTCLRNLRVGVGAYVECSGALTEESALITITSPRKRLTGSASGSRCLLIVKHRGSYSVLVL